MAAASVLDQLASGRKLRSEAPNRELAARLARRRDRDGIAEVARNLWNRDPAVQGDCIKVLYEIGYLDPVLIVDYAPDFLRLLESRNNRLVWGGMIALSTVAALKADALFPQREALLRAMRSGSVITVDNAVRTLALVAGRKAEYRRVLFPHLLEHLATCRPRQLPQHAESVLPAVDGGNKAEFVAVLETRLEDMLGAQVPRLKKTIRAALEK